ncbi:hypothetical protein COS75_02585 [Candidatus Pacearchaeota archaeon CG06_land_8_20_14_3_00_35_12]|nr:MAG: hypothetical protein COS75_02585 [Candidatus Pacearchaeota archaeon CG06_land_8_20_14_3_00_35_12]
MAEESEEEKNREEEKKEKEEEESEEKEELQISRKGFEVSEEPVSRGGRAPILESGKRIEAEENENLEQKLKEVPSQAKETEKAEKPYVSDYEEKRVFYENLEGQGLERPRHVEFAPERVFEKPARQDLELQQNIERKSELERHNVSDLLAPSHVEYKSEKGFLEFNPLKELKGHGREEIRKYRRH